MDLTNEQWQGIKDFIPKPKAKPGKSGRPPQAGRKAPAIDISSSGQNRGSLPKY
jgi:hypothetical protein